MPTISYYTVVGEILAEESVGTRTDYSSDGIGSVVSTQNNAGSTLKSYRYKPYGSELSKTGAGSDPRFRWLGSRSIEQGLGAHAPTFFRRGLYMATRGMFVSAHRVSDIRSGYGLGLIGQQPKYPICGSSAMPWKSMVPMRVDVGPADSATISHCGLANYRTVWKVPGQNIRKPGAVIQYVEYDFDFKDCQGKPWTWTQPHGTSTRNCPVKGNYLEIWSYTPNGHTPFIDTFGVMMRGVEKLDCLCGSAKIEGKVAYYEGCYSGEKGNPLKPWTEANCMSGDLPVVDTPAGILDELKLGKRTKSLNYKTNCCIGDKNNSKPYWGEGITTYGGAEKVVTGGCFPGRFPSCTSWDDFKPRKICDCKDSPCPIPKFGP
ncbi:MAG: hypothetical protein ACO1SV_05530 [Fimbriimonas sp.]